MAQKFLAAPNSAPVSSFFWVFCEAPPQCFYVIYQAWLLVL